ncbi:MAG: hypothetical protein KF690_03900 [Bacteroidetes bacterium]|nr:hypothetical protein [Bacteroidota bacterium]
MRKHLRQPWLYIALTYGLVMTWVRWRHWGETDLGWAIGESVASAIVMWLLLWTVFGKRKKE